MSSIPVHVGFWTDWTHGSVWGSSLTVKYSTGNIILAATAVFITIVGGFLWSITAYTIHYCLVQRKPVSPTQFSQHPPRNATHLTQSELIRLQQQLIFRNSEEPLAAVTELFRLQRTWRSQGHCFAPQSHTVIYPFVVWAAFIFAGVLSSKIANQPEQSSNVRVQRHRCGLWSFNLSTKAGVYDREVKLLNDTLGGRIYARSCYSDDWTANNPVSCSIYTKRNLEYTKKALNGMCPFGPNQDDSNLERSFFGGECDSSKYNEGSHQMISATLDSHYDLGINAPPRDRIQFQKTVTCSPVSTSNRTGVTTMIPAASNETDTKMQTTYNFGGINGISSYTYAYPASTKDDNVGYQITSVVRADQGGWTPVPSFYRTDGDVSLFFFAANSVGYTSQSLDPLYLAIYGNANTDPDLILYYASNPVSVMGCVDQYLIRNPNNGATTPWTGISNLTAAAKSLRLGPAQNVTTQRLLRYFALTNTYNSVLASGPNALKQADLVSNFRSSPPAYGQWRKEVEGWFETTLASLQAYAVEYAANVVSLGAYGSVTLPPGDAATLSAAQIQCDNQKINNSGTYQTFSVFGLMLIFSFGIVIILIDVFLERVVSHFRRKGNWPPAEIANTADDKFQLQRMMFEAIGYKGWYNGNEGHPWYSGSGLIPQPVLVNVTLPNSQQGQSVNYRPAATQSTANGGSRAILTTAGTLSTTSPDAQSSIIPATSPVLSNPAASPPQHTVVGSSSPAQPLRAATPANPTSSSTVNISSPEVPSPATTTVPQQTNP